MTLTEAVARGVATLQAHAQEDDDALARRLGGSGLEDELAAKLIQFLPIAFCRTALTQGQGGDFFLPVAARSAGYQVIQRLLQQGSQPENIFTSPPIIQAPTRPTKEGKKKWWQLGK